MLEWLTGSTELFGLAGQNWMWLTGGGFIIYIALLLVADRRHPV
jgi:hypothetical protein